VATVLLTYRRNNTGTLLAAYIRECRVGYVSTMSFNRWRWQLSLVMQGGGHAFGIEDDEAAARVELERSFNYWLACAGLQTIPHIDLLGESR
jgi:hypothetical protein